MTRESWLTLVGRNVETTSLTADVEVIPGAGPNVRVMFNEGVAFAREGVSTSIGVDAISNRHNGAQ